ncbi:hypothetical protein N7457_008086 [Penicillium paradoxum]|uniref:uncharacterized protein n=1 Tax=Penicillium paradoxum TaxID=176176 RepID=UPI002547D606|nr:uncharacterized protein N7457_008086 [Penicillium paradoxum]KAJ5773190.1 hypothetical protein N7457_008086 [Penicillium paradoxum]
MEDEQPTGVLSIELSRRSEALDECDISEVNVNALQFEISVMEDLVNPNTHPNMIQQHFSGRSRAKSSNRSARRRQRWHKPSASENPFTSMEAPGDL